MWFLRFKHIRPKPQDLRKTYGLSDPVSIRFFPILREKEFSHSCHCPRKAHLLYRMGASLIPVQKYERNWYNGNYFEHVDIFINVILNILKNLGGKLLNLKNHNPKERIWKNIIIQYVKDIIKSETAIIKGNIIKDITEFLFRWHSEKKLVDFFQDPLKFIFMLEIFNPHTKLNNTFPKNKNYGEAIGDFPFLGKVHIVDYKNKKLIELVCHKDEWLKTKQIKKMISDPSPQRTEEIVIEPFKLKLWVLRQGLSTFPSRYKIGAIATPSKQFGQVPQNYLPPLNDWEKFYSNFKLNIDTIEKTFLVNVNKENKIIEGRINSYLAFRGDSYRLNSKYSKPCDDPSGSLNRDIYCDLFLTCLKKSLSFLFLSMNFEIKRLEKRVFDEKILNLDWNYYRLVEHLPHNFASLNSTFLDFWMGDVIDRNPLKIKLRYTLPMGLNPTNEYLVFYWNPFIGPNDIYTLETIKEQKGDYLISFKENYPSLATDKCIFTEKREGLDLYKYEQEALYHHITHQYQDDPSTPSGAAIILEKVLEQGGKRLGHATFGGWAQFL